MTLNLVPIDRDTLSVVADLASDLAFASDVDVIDVDALIADALAALDHGHYVIDIPPVLRGPGHSPTMVGLVWH